MQSLFPCLRHTKDVSPSPPDAVSHHGSPDGTKRKGRNHAHTRYGHSRNGSEEDDDEEEKESAGQNPH